MLQPTHIRWRPSLLPSLHKLSGNYQHGARFPLGSGVVPNFTDHSQELKDEGLLQVGKNENSRVSL